MEPTSSAVGRPQHLGALERANRVRSARAKLKRRIADGELTAADAVLSHRWEIDRMPIGELLSSQRGWANNAASNSSWPWRSTRRRRSAR